MTVWAHIKSYTPKILLAVVLFIAVFTFVHNSPDLSRQRPVYTRNELSSATRGYMYKLNTYDGAGRLLANYAFQGLNLQSTHIGGVYNGYKALHDTLNITSSGGSVSMYDTPAVAYDCRLHNYKAVKYAHYSEPVLPSILHNKSNRKFPMPSKLLVIKTLSTQRIIAVFGGDNVYNYYSDINNVDIYKIDGNFVVTYDCGYSIVDSIALQADN